MFSAVFKAISLKNLCQSSAVEVRVKISVYVNSLVPSLLIVALNETRSEFA